MTQEFRLKNIEKYIRNYLIENINENELMSKKHKNVFRILNYIEHLLVSVFTVAGCGSVSAFSSLVSVLGENKEHIKKT